MRERNQSMGGNSQRGSMAQFPEVRGTFKDAARVKRYVIFDFRKNRYRLVTVIHYAKTRNQQRTNNEPKGISTFGLF